MHALGPLPWALTFSYGRALQEDALNAWEGKQTGYAGGQKALAKRAKLNGLAAVGQYNAGLESSAA
jgi:fructose-bisphosphate aldolase, class I